MLQIKNLHVSVGDKEIINNLNISFSSGTTTYLLGHNGAGKSSFALSLIGHHKYKVTGEINFGGENLTQLPTYKRARKGLFVTLQYPNDLPGVSIKEFLFESYKANHNLTDQARDLFNEEFNNACQLVGFENFEDRTIEGLSGGQRKRLELIQLYLCRPNCIILDEIDSGMDEAGITAIKKVLDHCRTANPKLIIIIITHYKDNKLFNPNRVLLMSNGQISE